MPGSLDARSLEAIFRKGEIDTVLTVVPDHYGRLMGKRMVGRHFVDHVLADGVHACIYLLTVDMEMEPQTGFKLTSWERGYGDMKMVPDLGTLRVIPWLPKTALVFCDVYDDDGEAIEEAPRWVLKRQVARAAAQGHLVKTAAELELYCFRETFEQARAKRYQNLTPVSDYLEDYHILQTTKEEPLIRAIRNGMEAADVPVETSKGEWRRGQEEINLVYAEAREMAYFYAPGVNSYKRYQAGSFAPTRIAVGWDNRTCGFRLCGEGGAFRVENRIPGADASPYLAFAATIAAGLHGVASKLKAPKPYEGNAYQDATLPQVPKTLREAIGELERSRVARAAFGDRVVDHYLHAARLEQQAFDQAVTDWELIRNFERI